jgi:hypothetical protein
MDQPGDEVKAKQVYERRTIRSESAPAPALKVFLHERVQHCPPHSGYILDTLFAEIRLYQG